MSADHDGFVAARPRVPRVLVLSADIGEGHLATDRLGTALREGGVLDVSESHISLSAIGERFGRVITRSLEVDGSGPGWLHQVGYRIFFGHRVPRRLGQLALAVLEQRGLRRAVAEVGPDVIVTEHPLLSSVLGELRAMGRFSTPLISSVSHPASLHYWTHPGIDLHLLAWPEARQEVDRIAGPGRAQVVRPLVPARQRSHPSHGVPGRPLVVVSGGGWGMGDLTGAVQTTLQLVPDAVVVALAARGQAAYERLSAAFSGEPRVRVLGFTDRMADLLGAADLLIHTAGGTTMLEARVSGCPLINYGPASAHVRAQASALAGLGLAQSAEDRTELGTAITRALQKGRPEPLELEGLPSTAEAVSEFLNRYGSQGPRQPPR